MSEQSNSYVARSATLKARLARLPTRGDLARTALGIIFVTVFVRRRYGNHVSMTADRDRGATIDGSHYRELARWLREIAHKCRLPNPQRELLDLARRYEIRAGHLDRPAR